LESGFRGGERAAGQNTQMTWETERKGEGREIEKGKGRRRDILLRLMTPRSTREKGEVPVMTEGKCFFYSPFTITYQKTFLL
jgi:hypothetical protein